MKPGEEIRLVKENLAFSIALWKGASSGRVPPQSLVRPSSEVPVFSQQLGNGHRADGELAAELIRGAANQMRAAFALSALQSYRSLAAAFPGEPIEEEWPELRAALSSMYLIGLAVQRSIVQPVWECPPAYSRLFHIHRLSFTLNASALQGRVLSWDDFGGLESYMKLLDYCARSADAAVDSSQGTVSRTLPKNPGSRRTAFGGVIGSPNTEPENDAPAPRVAPPRGYPGNQPQRRLAPDAPPFLPPRSLEPAGEDEDSWDIVIREQSGEWHQGQTPEVAVPSAGGAGDSNVRQENAFPPVPVVNLVRRFVDEQCQTGNERRMLAGELYAGFLGWCRDSGHQPISQRAFGMRLSSLGMRRKRRGHGKHWWEGIRLVSSVQPVA